MTTDNLTDRQQRKLRQILYLVEDATKDDPLALDTNGRIDAREIREALEA